MGKNSLKRISFLFALLSLAIAGFAYGQQNTVDGKKIIGEAFGKPVSEEEFNYHLKTAQIFTRFGVADNDKDNEERQRAEAWQNLVFLKEANDLGVKVSKEEVETELKRLLSEKNIEYGSENYAKWVKSVFGDDPATFMRRLEDLLKVNKFMKIKQSPEVSVSDEEVKEKFLNQYNSFESEYIRFETKEEAEEFQKQVRKNRAIWKKTFDQRRQAEKQKGAAWINIMSLEALIDLWKIPKEDAYRILDHKQGDFIVAQFYYGWGVFRLLYKRQADLAVDFDEKHQKETRDMMLTYKKRNIISGYLDDLSKRASYKDYVWEARVKAKIEEIKKKSLVVLKTAGGDIELKLYPDIAPKACENFIGLVEKGYYDGLIFHRVKKDFMIQTGDPLGTGAGGDSLWGGAFADEFSDKAVFDRPGLLAMANSGPNTNKSQFFITTLATPWLNGKHTIFGEVVSGMEAVRKIESAPTDSQDRPKKEEKIIRAFIKGG
jgi:peptidylprolyl isomerase